MNNVSFLQLILLLLAIHSCWSFHESFTMSSQKPRMFVSQNVRYPLKQRISTISSATYVRKLFATKTDQIDEKMKERNIFHEYNKPIVLLGCSSTGEELLKLSHSFHSANFANTSNEVVHLTLDNKSTILQSISSNELRWPSILLLDVGQQVQDSQIKQIDTKYISLLKEIYEEYDMLSVYVNVQSSASSDSTSMIWDKEFVKYSDYEICISDGDVDTSENWEHIVWEFQRLLARSRLIPAIPGDKKQTINTAHLTMGLHTFFLSLTFPDIRQVESYVEQMCKDVDAMEYRVDLLDCRDSRFDVIYGMQLLRKYCRPFVVRSPALPFGNGMIEDVIPIVYTIRTASQAGTFPDDEDGISKMYEMLEWGLRAGTEVLDIESAWDFVKTTKVLNLSEKRYSSQVLGSHHVVGNQIEMEDAVGLFEQCALNGRAHAAKVVLSIDSDKQDRMAYEAALIASELAEMDEEPVIPNIALILGDVGQFSRVINFPFTPVTHESLPFKAAPGQLTANEIMTTRLLTGLFRRKKFAILGCNISYSVSPEMHGAAFAATKLPHEYYRIDLETVEEFIKSEFFLSDDFGGTSVTIPHKQAIIPYVDVLSDAAKDIGSVNTISVAEEFTGDGFKRVIHGDNTDWRGIYNPINRRLSCRPNVKSDFALILGAGGTARAAAYAAKKMGLSLFFYNRTPENAKPLIDSFGGILLESLEDNADSENRFRELTKLLSLRVVISTLPAATKMVLPEWLLRMTEYKPIIFDVNYKPYYTSLLRQAEHAGCPIVRGSEMLWEQGVGQFEIWTERSAPYRVMKEVVLQNCDIS